MPSLAPRVLSAMVLAGVLMHTGSVYEDPIYSSNPSRSQHFSGRLSSEPLQDRGLGFEDILLCRSMQRTPSHRGTRGGARLGYGSGNALLARHSSEDRDLLRPQPWQSESAPTEADWRRPGEEGEVVVESEEPPPITETLVVRPTRAGPTMAAGTWRIAESSLYTQAMCAPTSRERPPFAPPCRPGPR